MISLQDTECICVGTTKLFVSVKHDDDDATI